MIKYVQTVQKDQLTPLKQALMSQFRELVIFSLAFPLIHFPSGCSKW